MRKATVTILRPIAIRLLWVVASILISYSAKAQCWENFDVYQVYPYDALCTTQPATLRANFYGSYYTYGEFRWYTSEWGYPVHTSYISPSSGVTYSDYNLYASPGQTVWVSFYNYSTGCETFKMPHYFNGGSGGEDVEVYQDYAKICANNLAQVQLSSNQSGAIYEIYKLEIISNPGYPPTIQYNYVTSSYNGYFEIPNFNQKDQYNYYCRLYLYGGCGNNNYYSLNIGDAPMDVGGDLNYCEGKVGVLGVGGAVDDFKWYNSSGNLVGEGHNYQIPASQLSGVYEYTVKGMSYDGCEMSSRTVTVTIDPKPVNGTISASAPSIYLGQSVTISSQGGVGTPYYWCSSNGGASWNVFSGTYIGLSSFQFTPTVPGTYRFHVYNQAACGFCWDAAGGGCTSSSYVDVNVYQPLTIGTIFPAIQSVNLNAVPVAISLTNVSGGNGNYSYLWQSSPSSSFTSPANVQIGGATFTPPSNTSGTTYYRVAVSSLGETLYSNAVPVIVYPAVVGGSLSPGTQYVNYNGATTTLSISGVSGGNGSYEYQWQWSASSSFAEAYDLAGMTGTTYTPPSGAAGTLYYQVRVRSNGATAYSNTASVTVYGPVQAGNASPASQVVNFGAGTTPLSLSGVSGGSGTYGYQWQSSTSPSFTTPTDIAGATGATYTPPSNIAGTLYYRAVVSSNGVNAYSAIGSVTVYPAIMAGTVSPVTQTCNLNAASVTISLSGVSGGNGSYSYQWQKASNSSFTDVSNIAGGVTPTYRPSTDVAGTSFYRVLVTSNGVSSVSSSAWVTVYPAVIGGSLSPASQNANYTGTTSTLTLSGVTGGDGSYTYQWQKASNASFTDMSVVSSSGTTYAPSSSAAGTFYYRVAVTSNGATAYSTTVTVTIYPPLQGGSASPGSQAVNLNAAVTTLSLSGVSGGSGSYSYQWQSASTSAFSNPTPITGATAATYAPPSNAPGTKYYRAAVSSNGVTVYSAISSVTVYPAVVGGSVSPSSQNRNLNSTPSNLTLSGVSGGNGAYSYQWQSSTSSSFTIPTNISGATATTYSPSTGTSGTTYYRVVVTSNGVSVYSASASVTVYPALQGGSLSPASQNVNYNGTTTNLALSGVSGGSGTYSYQWQKASNASFSDAADITGATATTYTPPSSTAGGLYYRVVVTSNGASVNSATAYVNIYPAVVGGSVSPATLGVNLNAASAPLSLSGVSGGNGTYSYQWQSSLSSSFTSPTNISGATSTTYTPPSNIAETKYYRATVSSNGVTAYSSSAAVTVYPAVVGGSLSPASQNANYNGATTTLTLSGVSGGNGSYSYQWQKADNPSFSGLSVVSTAETSYTPSSNEAKTYYYRVAVTSNGATANSNTATITVYPAVAASLSATSATINHNTSYEVSVNPSGGNGAYSYQWYSSANASTWTAIGGATSQSYNQNFTATTYLYCAVNSNGVTVTSNTATINVYPQLTCSISPASQSAATTVAASTLISSASGGDGSYSYQWQSSPDNANWTNVGTASSYSPGVLSGSRFYKLTVTSNGVNVNSNTATVTVLPIASLSISNVVRSANGSYITFNCTASGGNGSYSYAWYSSVDNGNTYQSLGATGSSYTTNFINSSTKFYVTVTSEGNPANSNIVDITMPAPPSVSATTTALCNGGSATLTATAGGGNYTWYNAGDVSVGTGVNFTTSTAGTYYATSSNAYGESVKSSFITLTAFGNPVVGSITGSTVCVLGSSTQLVIAADGGVWSSSDNTTLKVDNGGIITGLKEGTATISYTLANPCGSASQQLAITVVPFSKFSSELGKGIDDPLITDTISLVPAVSKITQYLQDTIHSSAHTIQNVIALRINEETEKYIPGEFTATAVVKVEYGHSADNFETIDSTRLTVTYSKEQGTKYDALNYFAFKNAEYVKLTVVRVDAPTTVAGVNFDTKQVLVLTNMLAGTRYFKMADNQKPTASYTVPPAGTVPDELPVSWIFPANTNNNSTQLEWTWLEDEMSGTYTNGAAFDTSLLFRNNATRIDLPGGIAGAYNIPLLYGGEGKLFFRVRGSSIMPSGSSSDGPWSGVQTYSFSGHADSLNWQVTTSFAEEGKRKTVMQYYDGSLRTRQTVTKDNSTNKTVVAETFYDGQGRPAVQILPAPGISDIINYTSNLNRFAGYEQNDPLDGFDFTVAGSPFGKYGTAPLNTSSGTAKYYSNQNPEVNDNQNKHIADANGYPYTVTRYTPDATGRIMMQSGVGDNMKMGSSHVTKYYYGTAAQEELDALFGTEVGNYTHYFKNMVQDANGQMSVSYADMHGRTIATALAGEAPAGMQALNINDATHYSNQSGKVLTRNLLDKGSNVLKENSIESINTILVPFKTLYDFTYNLPVKTLQLPTCTGGTITYNCKFDLQISISDESGDTSAFIFNYPGIDQLNFHQPVMLPAGSYSVRKTLSINQDSLNKFFQQYNTVNVGLCRTQQFLTDSIAAKDSTASGCGVTTQPMTCTSCKDSLGTFTQYLTKYANSIGVNPVGNLTQEQWTDIRNQYINDSLFCVSLNGNVSHTLENIRQQMLADMIPFNGQYAQSEGTGSMYESYNIFTNTTSSPYMRPLYKYPKNRDFTADHYYDLNGQIDEVETSGRLTSMTKDEFEESFKMNWASSLLPYHPEFHKLKFAEDNLRSSFNFIDSMNFSVNTAFNPIPVDPYFNMASTINDKDSMTKYSTNVWNGGYSMWQLAYADAFGCKTVPDTSNRKDCYNNMPKQFITIGTSVNTGSGFVTLSSDIQAQAWRMYKGFYMQVRDEMVNRYINLQTDTLYNRDLIKQGFRIYFPYSKTQQAEAAGWSSWYPDQNGVLPTISLSDSVAKYSSPCEGYIDAWKSALLQCPTLINRDSVSLAQVMASITGKLLQVCKNGTDLANPNGSSTVSPANAGATYTSFEQAVYSVLDSLNISRSLVCHPYDIGFPRPYGKNPVVSKQYTASVDSCNCSQFVILKAQASAAGYSVSSLSSINQYLRFKNKDSITTVLYNGLLKCGQPYLYNCRTTSRTATCYDDHEAPYPCTIESTVCDTLRNLPLLSPQPLPAYLTCGYQDSICYNCDTFKQFDTSFYNLFGKHPDFTGTVNDTVYAYNELFAKYVNFKTGLQHNWQYYQDKFMIAGCPVGGLFFEGTGNISICIDKKPLTDTTGLTQTISPCQQVRNRAVVTATMIYEAQQEQLLANFKAAYLAQCLAVAESFTVTDTVKEYHYTLYYYDQAGNLVKTVPPKGVKPDYSQTWLTNVANARAAGTWLVPAHGFLTRYCYNSLNQVTAQKTPDAGVSNFWYDRLGRLTLSQNAKQNEEGNVYSYTQYDALGRITQVGQITGGTAMTNATAKDETSLSTWFTNAASTRKQITQTGYDVAYGTTTQYPNGALWGLELNQQHLRNRVSYTQVINNASDPYAASATYYSYDIHGNVDTLLQDFGNSSGVANVMNQNNHRFKRIVYNYDLISGKVNLVCYQPSHFDAATQNWVTPADQYYHRYVYDAENRLTDVFSGRDSVMLFFFPEREARYRYYLHGPLARTELGQLKAQGLDYAYTLQGWLKGVNSTSVNDGSFDMGEDGKSAGMNSNVARDAFGYSLNYYNNDYKPIGTTSSFVANTFSLTNADGGTVASPLYNGNIASMLVNTPKLGNAMLYGYKYDQLNRIVSMDAFNGFSNTSNTLSAAGSHNYKERVSYDPDGNILGYLRNGSVAGGKPLAMDSLTYHYISDKNQLGYVRDTVRVANYTEDIDIQNSGNYTYDAIGNLTSDAAEGITNITWNVYGKIASITKGGSVISYVYDAAGNRILKQTPLETTAYVRDASGNVLSVYRKPAAGNLVQSEINLYGSSRLGMATQHGAPEPVVLTGGFGNGLKAIFTRGEKYFELTNHLQNVLVTISDKKIEVDTDNNGQIDYYIADVISAQDYYPFGMTMPGRTVASGAYRYGFNGKENSPEINSGAVSFEARIYDSRLGKFFSVDPLAGEYPHQSTYVYAANNPISLIDILGLGAGDPPTSTSKEALTTIGEQKGKLKQSTFFKNITPESLLASLEREVSDPDNNFSQGKGTNFCSKAAAVSQVWAKNDPKGYANFILDLYNNGKATYNGQEINTGTNAEDAAGKLDAVGLANNPSAQMAFIALTVKYNNYMGSFKKGDEKSEILSGTFLGTFNTILTDFLGYKIESKGSSAGNRPYVNDWTKNTSNITDVISDLNSQLNKGAVILMINGPRTRGEGNWSIATHFIRLYNIQKLSTPVGGRDIMYERWDYGKKTVHYIGADTFMRSVQGVTTVLGSK